MDQKTIAILEDEPALAKILAQEFSEAGFQVVSAYDGATGLDLIRARHPDLVLLDLLLPKKHGLDVLREIKASESTKNIPVFVLTLLGDDDDMKKAAELGADKYLIKSRHSIAEIIENARNILAHAPMPPVSHKKISMA